MGTLIVDTIGGRNDNSPNQSDGLTVTGVCSATDFSGLVGGAADFPNGLTATTVTTTGNVSVGGTLTYDDVTNIDSVGIVTAGKGFRATTGGLHVVAGVSTLAGGTVMVDSVKAKFGTGDDLQIYHNGTHSYISNDTGDLILGGGNGTSVKLQPEGGEDGLTVNQNGSVDLYYDNSKKIETISTGASVYGGLRLQGGGLIRENLNISGTALNSNSVINLSEGMVHYRSAAVGGANVKLNVISNAGVNTDMAIGDILAVTVITVAASASHFVNQIRIDGVEATAGVTTNWSGGSAPSDGGTTGIDSYAFNVMKTGNATYVLLANQTKTS